MAHHRRHIGASRRQRRDDEGEDEGSQVGDLDDDSLSEGSVGTHQEDEDADVEGSDTEDEAPTTETRQVNGKTNGRDIRPSSTSPTKSILKTTVSDTEAMLGDPKGSEDSEETQLDQLGPSNELQAGRTPSAPPTEPKRESLAIRKRRDHEKNTKEREQNPTFVPTRGEFFLHDKRSTEKGSGSGPGSGSNNHRGSNKGKSRPYGLIVDSNTRRNSFKGDASEGQWAHDLHETVAGDDPPAPKETTTLAGPQPGTAVPTAPRSSPPNRSFSSTTLVGTVPVVVFLPGMKEPKSFPAVPKKQHTRLPQHRPPLRRDKPVRISLPNHSPSYIYPSMERSFIFIPRALRPNQSWRGRGRGGGGAPGSMYGGSRRPSYFPTAYPPSLPPSRRTSLGMSSQDGYPSPAGSTYSRPSIGKPVVRLPPQRPMFPPGPVMPMGPPGTMPPMIPMQNIPFQHPPYRENRHVPIPMHQPRPKKTVSVADIESPDNFPINPPQPQHEQPFHHQVPLGVSAGPGHEGIGPSSSQPSATPLSQIPERAIHAPSFQPTPYSAAYYPGYPPNGGYYPPYGPFNGPMGPGVSMPNFPGGVAPQPMAFQPHLGPSGEQPSQPGMVAHEAGGTVYFYDANQMYSPNYGMHDGPGGVVGMGGMMTPPTPFYYPQPSGPGVYYPAQ
ncbi:uncharacterized protein N7483_007799 [Penicillium malachiteum]|uniref:uncharacterized protein n=1 Tax=Penicillium malachiteum TaxID=1324776 RepID=UPI002548A3DB|nr:uncharacterized protein N7483_007799 [Penicillium malachiteum]KAJ5726442.1 hypothetical protein N7483_007799 [Penicillium malachiteum]